MTNLEDTRPKCVICTRNSRYYRTCKFWCSGI